MTFDINDAVVDGWDRITTGGGLTLVAAFVALGIATTFVTNSLLRVAFLESGVLDEAFAEAPPGSLEEFRTQFESQVGADVLGLPLEPLLGLILALWIARFVLKIGAIRWFVDLAEDSLHGGLFTKRFLWTVGNLIVGGILYVVVVGIGLVLLVVPGIFLAVALFFYNYEIVVEGENAIEALANSWEITKGNRLRLFLLGLLFAVAGTVLGWITGPIAAMAPTVGGAVATTVTAAFGVFGIAVAAAAYRQLTSPPAGPDEADEEVGALGPDDL